MAAIDKVVLNGTGAAWFIPFTTDAQGVVTGIESTVYLFDNINNNTKVKLPDSANAAEKKTVEFAANHGVTMRAEFDDVVVDMRTSEQTSSSSGNASSTVLTIGSNNAKMSEVTAIDRLTVPGFIVVGWGEVLKSDGSGTETDGFICIAGKRTGSIEKNEKGLELADVTYEFTSTTFQTDADGDTALNTYSFAAITPVKGKTQQPEDLTALLVTDLKAGKYVPLNAA